MSIKDAIVLRLVHDFSLVCYRLLDVVDWLLLLLVVFVGFCFVLFFLLLFTFCCFFLCVFFVFFWCVCVCVCVCVG